MEPIKCPTCGADLVHDENNVFNRCLGCGYNNRRQKDKERFNETMKELSDYRGFGRGRGDISE